MGGPMAMAITMWNQYPQSVTPPPSGNEYVTEAGDPYVTEGGTDPYVPES